MSLADVPAHPAGATDRSACAREPIHIPGSIQPHGVLFALDTGRLTLTHVSANVAAFVGRPPEALLGRPIDEILGEPFGQQLRATLGAHDVERNPIYLRTLTPPNADASFNAIVHRHAGAVILELEPASSSDAASFQQLYPMVRTFVNRLQATADVPEICHLAAEEVRRITGFDRVLVYRFDKDWNGTVVGESRDDLVYGSFLGLRFPASDIPAQARELYRVNRLRLIADANYRPSPIVPATNPATARPPDLSSTFFFSIPKTVPTGVTTSG